jgi:hypothetical protein
VIAVERTPPVVHGRVVLPRLGDHHEHGVRQRAPGQVEELEHLVEAGRVTGPGCANRVDATEVAVDEWCGQEGFPGAHPVAVAGQRVDLAVVRHVAVGMGQRPTGERVRREPRVHQRQPRLEQRVFEVGKERPQLLGGQHAFVDDGA